MAAVMGETYPDLYAAVGIHSGLAYGSANDVMSAFSAMRGDAGLVSPAKPRTAATGGAFTGSARSSSTAARTGRSILPMPDRIVADCQSDRRGRRRPQGKRPRRRWANIYKNDRRGSGRNCPAVEYWLVEGSGHAWSGGKAGGSFTDPHGPDASGEMVRFFLDD